MSRVSNQRPGERRRWDEYVKEFSRAVVQRMLCQSRGGPYYTYWKEPLTSRTGWTNFEQLRSCTSLPSNAGLLEKDFLYLIDRRKTSQCRVVCPLDLTRKLSLTGAIVGHSSAARIHRAIPQLSTADLSSSYVVDNEGGFHPAGASPPVPWSLRYAPEEERYVLKS